MPPTSDGTIELGNGAEPGSAELGDHEFGAEKRPLRIQDVAVTRNAAFVAQKGKFEAAALGGDGLLLGSELFGEFLGRDKRVFDFAKGGLDRALIIDERFAALTAGDLNAAGDAPGVEDGGCELRSEAPGLRSPGIKEVMQFNALQAERRSEGNCGKVRGDIVPLRSCNTKLKPPAAPKPGREGGAITRMFASGRAPNSRVSRPMMPCKDRSAVFRSSQGRSRMKKDAE